MATCKFTLLPCPKECKDNKKKITHIMRKDLDKHLENDCPNRDQKCEYCGKKGTYAHITQVHDSICERKTVSCPNADCTKTIQRRNTKRHLEECDYSEIPCKYQKIGCGVKIMRKNMRTHEDNEDKLHLHIALDQIITIKEEFSSLSAIGVIRNGEKLTCKLTRFQDKMDHIDGTLLPTFYSSPNGYHMRLQVYANGIDDGHGTHMSVYVHMLRGRHDDDLKWSFVGTVHCEILNQLKESNHYIMKIPMKRHLKFVVGEERGYDTFIPHSALTYDPVKNTQYLKDDTLYFRVSVDTEVTDHKHWLETGVHN